MTHLTHEFDTKAAQSISVKVNLETQSRRPTEALKKISWYWDLFCVEMYLPQKRYLETLKIYIVIIDRLIHIQLKTCQTSAHPRNSEVQRCSDHLQSGQRCWSLYIENDTGENITELLYFLFTKRPLIVVNPF